MFILEVFICVMSKFIGDYMEKRKDIAPLIGCSRVATGSPHFWSLNGTDLKG